MSEWIPVTDKRKPPNNRIDEFMSETVLLYVPKWENKEYCEPVVMGHFLRYGQKFRPSGSSGCENDVTHWMPLPEPPK